MFPRMIIRRTSAIVALAVMALFGAAPAAHAALIASWDFNDSNVTVDSGAGSAPRTLTNGFPSGSTSYVTGTTVNAVGATPAGNALRLKSQSNQGAALTFAINTSGYKDITLSYASQKTSNNSFDTQTVAYETSTGGGFTNLSSFSPQLNNYTPAASFNFAGIPALNNNAQARFSITFTGGSNANNVYNLLDNIQFNGTPLQSTISLTATAQHATLADSTNPYGAAGNIVDIKSGLPTQYASEIDDLTANANQGSAALSPIAHVGPTLVMLWLTGPDAEVDALIAALDGQTDYDIAAASVSSGDALYADIQTLLPHYDGFSALVSFDHTVGGFANDHFNWNFEAHPNVLVDAIAAVPEPSSLAMLLAAGLLLTRRRQR